MSYYTINMNITVTVMAHPARKSQAESLALELKSYPFTDVTITWDELNSEWDTGRRAWSRGVGRGDWHLVVQDDAILTPLFYDNLVNAINTLPSDKTMISLYVGQAKPLGRRVKEAVAKAYYATWLRLNMLTWGVAVIMPSDHIEPMLEMVGEPRWDETPYDVRIGMFYQRNRIPIYYTMPSLVDHDEGLGSLLEHDVPSDEPPRVAHRVAEGLVKWNKQFIDI